MADEGGLRVLRPDVLTAAQAKFPKLRPGPRYGSKVHGEAAKIGKGDPRLKDAGFEQFYASGEPVAGRPRGSKGMDVDAKQLFGEHVFFDYKTGGAKLTPGQVGSYLDVRFAKPVQTLQRWMSSTFEVHTARGVTQVR